MLCTRNTPKIVTFVIGPKMPFTYVVKVYSDMLLSKGHLGSRGGGGGESI